MFIIANTNTNTKTNTNIPTNKDVHTYIKPNVNTSIKKYYYQLLVLI